MKKILVIGLLVFSTGCYPNPDSPHHKTLIKILKEVEIRNQIDDEMAGAISELRALHDPRIDKILQPHQTRIDKLVDDFEKIKEEK